MRVVGHIEPGVCFRAAVTQRPVVLARYLGGRGRRRDETRGVDFAVVTDAGQRFVVRVSDQTYLDERPPRPPRGQLAEQAVGPGDLVEVIGVETHEVDPSADRASARATPFQVCLSGADIAPLVVRPLRRREKLRPAALTSPFWDMT